MTKKPVKSVAEQSNVVVGKITVNAAKRIYAQISHGKYEDRLDLRVWYLADDDTYRPTKNGLNTPLAGVKELRKLLKQCREHERGIENDAGSSSHKARKPKRRGATL